MLDQTSVVPATTNVAVVGVVPANCECRSARPLTYIIGSLQLFTIASAVIAVSATHWYQANDGSGSFGLASVASQTGNQFVSYFPGAVTLPLTQQIISSATAASVLISIAAFLSFVGFVVLLFRTYCKETTGRTSTSIALSFLAFAAYIAGFGAAYKFKSYMGTTYNLSLNVGYAYGLALAGFVSEFIVLVLLLADKGSDQYAQQLAADSVKPVIVPSVIPLGAGGLTFRTLARLFVLISGIIVVVSPHWYDGSTTLSGSASATFSSEAGLVRTALFNLHITSPVSATGYNTVVNMGSPGANPDGQSHAQHLVTAGFTLIVSAIVAEALGIYILHHRRHYNETESLRRWQVITSFLAFALYLAGWCCAQHYLIVYTNGLINTVATSIAPGTTASTHYTKGYAYGLAIAGWAVAFFSFIGSLHHYRVSKNAIASAVPVKTYILPPNAAWSGTRAFSFLSLLFVVASAVLVTSEVHWFYINYSSNPNNVGFSFGLYDACSGGTCVTYGNLGLSSVIGDTFSGLGTVAIQDSAMAALTLISVAAILGGFSLILLRFRAHVDTYSRATLYNLLTFTTFATYLTGFGAAESLKHELKNAGFDTLNYGWAFGLAIAGWCIAFIVFFLGLLEFLGTKVQYTEAIVEVAVVPVRPKRSVLLLALLFELFVAVAAVINAASPDWFFSDTFGSGIGPSNCNDQLNAGGFNKSIGDSCEAANTLLALTVVFAVLTFLILLYRLYSTESRSAATLSIWIALIAFATYITAFGAMFRLKEVFTDQNGSSLSYSYDVGLSLAGWAVAFVVFVLLVADLQSTGFATLAAADAAQVKVAAQRADLSGGVVAIRLLGYLYVLITGAIVVVSSHWYVNNNTEVGLTRGYICTGGPNAPCTLINNVDVSENPSKEPFNERLVAAGFALIVTAVVAQVLAIVVLLYRLWWNESVCTRTTELVFTFLAFATYLAGFGCATHLKKYYIDDLALVTALSYGYAFGLAISGWAIAFLSFIGVLVTYPIPTNTKPTQTLVLVNPSPSTKPLQTLFAIIQLFVVISVVIVASETHWFYNSLITFGLYKWCEGYTCYGYPYFDTANNFSFGTMRILDASEASLALLAAAAILTGLSLLVLFLRSKQDTRALAVSFVLLSFFGFVAYLTGFGGANRLKYLVGNEMKTNAAYNNNGDLKYGFSYGLSIAGWACAFVTFLLALGEVASNYSLYHPSVTTVTSPPREIAMVEIQQPDGTREEVIVEQVGTGPVEVVTVPVVTLPEGAPVQ